MSIWWRRRVWIRSRETRRGLARGIWPFWLDICAGGVSIYCKRDKQELLQFYVSTSLHNRITTTTVAPLPLQTLPWGQYFGLGLEVCAAMTSVGRDNWKWFVEGWVGLGGWLHRDKCLGPGTESRRGHPSWY